MDYALAWNDNSVTKIRINKIDAAKRQINAAIRMTFQGEDPVAIHSVIAAGHRIIRDICQKRGDVESFLRFTDWIAEGHEKQFWAAMNASANFIKHADTDADAIHEFDEEMADFMIVFASKWYGDLGYSRSREMNTFATWWAIQHPQGITPTYLEVIKKAGFLKQFEVMQREVVNLSRKDRLRIGQLFLDQPARNISNPVR